MNKATYKIKILKHTNFSSATVTVAIRKLEQQVCKASDCGNNRDHPTGSLHYCLFAPHILYMGVILHTHPAHGESHIQHNANGEVAATSPPF